MFQYVFSFDSLTAAQAARGVLDARYVPCRVVRPHASGPVPVPNKSLSCRVTCVGRLLPQDTVFVRF